MEATLSDNIHDFLTNCLSEWTTKWIACQKSMKTMPEKIIGKNSSTMNDYSNEY